MQGQNDFHSLKAMLDWQVALGADEAIQDVPVDRYAAAQAAAAAPKPKAVASRQAPTPAASPATAPDLSDMVDEAKRLAASADDLEALRDALAGFAHCDLRHGARNLVFSDGRPEARVMLIGEAPGRDEDRQGRPFVGRAGQMLDRMLAAIGLARDAEDPAMAVYITNMLPWRPPHNRDPSMEEIAMLKPFIDRHVELANPDILVLVGNWACQGMLGRRGILRLRGTWTEVLGRPALPITHPAYLLRTPEAKREAWQDLLSLQAKLREGG